jgi:hypothetical protein
MPAFARTHLTPSVPPALPLRIGAERWNWRALYNAAGMLERRVIRDLEGQVSASHVYTRPADLAAYAYDAWGA